VRITRARYRQLPISPLFPREKVNDPASFGYLSLSSLVERDRAAKVELPRNRVRRECAGDKRDPTFLNAPRSHRSGQILRNCLNIAYICPDMPLPPVLEALILLSRQRAFTLSIARLSLSGRAACVRAETCAVSIVFLPQDMPAGTRRVYPAETRGI